MDPSTFMLSSLPSNPTLGSKGAHDRTLVLNTYLELLHRQVKKLYSQVLVTHAASLALPKPSLIALDLTSSTTTKSKPVCSTPGQAEGLTLTGGDWDQLVDQGITRTLQKEHQNIQARLTSLSLQATVAFCNRYISTQDYQYIFNEQKKLNQALADIEQRLIAIQILYEWSKGIPGGLYQSVYGRIAIHPRERPVPNPYNPKYAEVDRIMKEARARMGVVASEYIDDN